MVPNNRLVVDIFMHAYRHYLDQALSSVTCRNWSYVAYRDHEEISHHECCKHSYSVDTFVCSSQTGILLPVSRLAVSQMTACLHV